LNDGVYERRAAITAIGPEQLLEQAPRVERGEPREEYDLFESGPRHRQLLPLTG
jgi:hypothetical protein